MNKNPYDCSCGWTHWRPNINIERELITKRFAYSIDYNIIFIVLHKNCSSTIRELFNFNNKNFINVNDSCYKTSDRKLLFSLIPENLSNQQIRFLIDIIDFNNKKNLNLITINSKVYNIYTKYNIQKKYLDWLWDIVSNNKFYKMDDQQKILLVLRDPESRILSQYNEILKIRHDGPYDITKNTNFYKQFLKDNKTITEKNFDIFLDDIKDNFYDSHLFPQNWFLDDLKITIEAVDFLINYKTFNKQFIEILEYFNINKNIPQENISKIKYNINIEKFREKINNLYKKDYELIKQTCNKEDNS